MSTTKTDRGDRGQLLPARRLVFADAVIGEGWCGSVGRPHLMLVATGAPCSLRLLHVGQQLAGTALGPEPDFAGATLRLRVLSLTKIGLHRHGLVANLLDFVDVIRIGDGSAHRIVARQR